MRVFWHTAQFDTGRINDVIPPSEDFASLKELVDQYNQEQIGIGNIYDYQLLKIVPTFKDVDVKNPIEVACSKLDDLYTMVTNIQISIGMINYEREIYREYY